VLWAYLRSRDISSSRCPTRLSFQCLIHTLWHPKSFSTHQYAHFSIPRSKFSHPLIQSRPIKPLATPFQFHFLHVTHPIPSHEHAPNHAYNAAPPLHILRLWTRAGLDDIPCLGLADTHGLVGKTLGIAVAALPRVLSVWGIGKDGSSQEGDEDDEDGEIYRDLEDDGRGVVIGRKLIGCWLMMED
jgi:hypothetical protein